VNLPNCIVAALVAASLHAAIAAPLREIRCPTHENAGEVVCRELDVLENPARVHGRTIALRIMILRAEAATPEPDPMFVVAGGPGLAATEGSFFGRFFAPVRAKRDVVLVDQRGTGGSNPLALAPMEIAYFVRPEMNFPPEWGRAALTRLRGQADLTQYTTARAVADLDAVRAALGYERINLYGTSYGTRVVQYYIKRHRERVRAAILKGVVTPENNVALSYGRNPQRALDLLIAMCAADTACAATAPTLKADVQSVLDRLERSPVTIETPHPKHGKPTPFVITRGSFAFGIRSQMMSASSFVKLPQLIAQAAAGDFSAWAPYLAQVRKSYATDLFGGMTFSVVAAEDVPRLTEDAIRADADGTFIGDALARGFQELKSFWPRGEAPADLFEQLESDVPVLMVSGQLDPATPPEGAEAMLPGLPNARHLVFAGAAHSAANFTGLDAIVEAFVREGSAKSLDVAAADNNRPPPFPAPTKSETNE
jgi:pimeloyl-ACP methyl ester carboxylesterase